MKNTLTWKIHRYNNHRRKKIQNVYGDQIMLRVACSIIVQVDTVKNCRTKPTARCS